MSNRVVNLCVHVFFLTSFLLLIFNPNIGSFNIFASHCAATDYDCQIKEIQTEIDALKPAHESNKKELSSLNTQLADLKKKITSLSSQLTQVEKDILKREEDLAYAREIFNQKAKNHYQFIRTYDPLAPFLNSQASQAFREIVFRQKASDEDRKTMEKYGQDLLALKNDKDKLEKSKTSLAAAQKNLDSRAKFLGSEVSKVETYIASLSAKQQEIVNAKSGSFITSVGDVELADDYNASIKGFREAAPSGSFAVFSFGGYTHRKGMSQYGARGRAQNGQNFSQILQAYYGKAPVNKDTSGSIIVNGASMDFENHYLMGIAEMPSSWHAEALKAQAVAARTYAYRYKVEGKSICTTESCQVFSSSKAANPPASWKQAVEATRGQIIEDVTTFYASTSGGYLTTSGWDTTNGSGGSDFIDRAWESKGGSPWLYKSWYRKGYTSGGDTCGKSNPWLTNEELTDLVNAALVLKNKNDDRIVPITTSCWGGNPYSYAELRQVAAQYGGITSVTSVSVSQGNGVTNTVTINGTVTLSGIEFKQGFNVRAPGYLRIPQGTGFGSSTNFAFFNIEKK